MGDKDSIWTKMSLQRWEMGTWAVSIASMQKSKDGANI